MTGREQNQHLDNLSEAPYILVLGQHLNKEVVSEPKAKRAALLQVEWNTEQCLGSAVLLQASPSLSRSAE